ncbi:hypothetical protein FJZ31_40375 [Candidatus Poribacteria bacterium]|nr:hypothetical protein [Candidatus Poribacteria bacterium]
MSKQKKSITRREFIKNSIQGAGFVSLGGALGFAASRFLSDTKNKKPDSVREGFHLKKLKTASDWKQDGHLP